MTDHALHLVVEDVPAAVDFYERALGARVARVRTGEVLDPSGHRWAFDQRVREVPVEEIEAQLAGMFDGA